MKAIYKDFEIEASRAKCLGGWMQTYLTAYSTINGYELICDHTEAKDPVRYLFDSLKRRIDEAYETRGESECVERGTWERAIGFDKTRRQIAEMSNEELAKLRRAIVGDEELPERVKEAIAELHKRRKANV